jgi:hypothetical protein
LAASSTAADDDDDTFIAVCAAVSAGVAAVTGTADCFDAPMPMLPMYRPPDNIKQERIKQRVFESECFEEQM